MEISKSKHPQDKVQFWQLVIARQKKSGLSISEFCRNEGLSYHAMDYWRRKFNRCVRSKDLIPVPVLQVTSAEKPASLIVRIRIEDLEFEFSTYPDVDWLISLSAKLARGGQC